MMKTNTYSQLTSMTPGAWMKCLLATLILIMACSPLAKAQTRYIDAKPLIIGDLNTIQNPTNDDIIAKKAFGAFPDSTSEILGYESTGSSGYKLHGSNLDKTINFGVTVESDGTFAIQNSSANIFESGSGLNVVTSGSFSFVAEYDVCLYQSSVCVIYSYGSNPKTTRTVYTNYGMSDLSPYTTGGGGDPGGGDPGGGDPGGGDPGGGDPGGGDPGGGDPGGGDPGGGDGGGDGPGEKPPTPCPYCGGLNCSEVCETYGKLVQCPVCNGNVGGCSACNFYGQIFYKLCPLCNGNGGCEYCDGYGGIISVFVCPLCRELGCIDGMCEQLCPLCFTPGCFKDCLHCPYCHSKSCPGDCNKEVEDECTCGGVGCDLCGGGPGNDGEDFQ